MGEDLRASASLPPPLMIALQLLPPRVVHAMREEIPTVSLTSEDEEENEGKPKAGKPKRPGPLARNDSEKASRVAIGKSLTHELS